MSQRQRPRNFDFDCDRRQPCPCCCHISRRTLRGSSSAASNFASVASSSTPCSTSRSSSSRRWTSTGARSCPIRTSCHWVASSSQPCSPSHHASSVVWVSQKQTRTMESLKLQRVVFSFEGLRLHINTQKTSSCEALHELRAPLLLLRHLRHVHRLSGGDSPTQ